MDFLGTSITLTNFPQVESNDADDLNESRSKLGLDALEKSRLQVTFA